jgi:ADP-heptose:LPS heptosyltransferase
MAKYYGLREDLDFRALRVADGKGGPLRVGLICGPQSPPGKVWPEGHWRRLIDGLLADRPGTQIVLLGEADACPVAGALAEGFSRNEVVNRTGETTLSELCDALSGCGVVCGHDSDGVHLANLLGTPVVAILGPSEPMQSEPVFDAPKVVLRPEGRSPETERVTPERAREAVGSLLQSTL